MKRLSLALVLLVTGAAQGQTLHTCGSKHADPKHCLAADLCVQSPTTHKVYCGATMPAAEAQEMAHEDPQHVQPGIYYGDNWPVIHPVVTMDHVTVRQDIPYCDQVLGTDDECVMRKGQWKQFQNDWVKQKDCAPRAGGVELGKTCPSREHRSLIDISVPPPIGTWCAGTSISDCSTHHVIDVCEKDK